MLHSLDVIANASVFSFPSVQEKQQSTTLNFVKCLK